MNDTGLATPPPHHQAQAGSSSGANQPTAAPSTSAQATQDPSQNVDMDRIVSTVMDAASPAQLSQVLRSCAPKDARETILSSFTSSGVDPLTLLDVQAHTIGVLYILSARLHNTAVGRPPRAYVEQFCQSFDPAQARYAPDRVTMLAKGIFAAAELEGNLKVAVQPLFNLISRYPPSFSHLTTLHSIFLRACVTTRNFAAALPVLACPISVIDTTLSDLHYNDNLVYHYAGGVALAALKRWAEAEEFFEICVTSPGGAAAAVQFDALKRLVLVQLIHRGTMLPPPKNTHLVLARLLKNTPYSMLAYAYPQKRDRLREIIEQEQQTLTTDQTLGLVLQALDRAPRWSIKRLTETYLTLPLSEIGRVIAIEDTAQVKALVVSMIESSEITATLSADGIVTFSDPPLQLSKTDVDRILLDAQEQSMLLHKLERDMAKSREYLTKAVRSREDGWSHSMDEDMPSDRAAGSGWADEMFA